MLMDVVVEGSLWWRLWMWCKCSCLSFFWRGCLGDMMTVRVVIEVLVARWCCLVWWCWCGGGAV